LLREENIQNLEDALDAALKIKKNLLSAKKVQAHSSRLFDPQGRTLLESKKEMGAENIEVLARFINLLQHLCNKMVRLEKNLQNQ